MYLLSFFIFLFYWGSNLVYKTPMYYDLCFILIYGGQCSKIVRILLLHGDINSLVIGLLHYNARQFITLWNVRGDVHFLIRKIHEIHPHYPPPQTMMIPQYCMLPVYKCFIIIYWINYIFQISHECFWFALLEQCIVCFAGLCLSDLRNIDTIMNVSCISKLS